MGLLTGSSRELVRVIDQFRRQSSGCYSCLSTYCVDCLTAVSKPRCPLMVSVVNNVPRVTACTVAA